MGRTNSGGKALVTTELLNSINASLGQQNISRKSKFRYLLARNENFEKQIADLVQALSAYTRRNAKVRDSGDVVAETINSISIAEVLNPSLKRSMTELSKSIRNIQDHRDSEILYFEDKLLPNIVQFGETLHKQREELRSNSVKVFDNRERNSKWTKSTNSNRRRSQSVERSDKPSKEEKALQILLQKYELKRNLLLKQLLLKFMLSELRFTIRSFNNLTSTYKYILKQMKPHQDLKLFNEFFDFQSMKRSVLTEIEDDVSAFESGDDANDSLNDYELTDQTDDEDKSDDDDLESESADSSDNEISDNASITVKSTLKRFNSTPEMPISLSSNEHGNSSEDMNIKKTTALIDRATNLNHTNLNNSSYRNDNSVKNSQTDNGIRNSFDSSKNVGSSSRKNKLENHKNTIDNSDDETDDSDDDSDDTDTERENRKHQLEANRIQKFKNKTK